MPTVPSLRVLPKEIKAHENRVAVLPSGVRQLKGRQTVLGAA